MIITGTISIYFNFICNLDSYTDGGCLLSVLSLYRWNVNHTFECVKFAMCNFNRYFNWLFMINIVSYLINNNLGLELMIE